MNKNKIGTMLMVSVLSLAGIGIAYAGLTDTLSIYGTANTARVQFENLEYTGTWVYKVWDMPIGVGTDPEWSGYVEDYSPVREILIFKGDKEVIPTESEVQTWAQSHDGNAELVSWAESRPLSEGYLFDVEVEFYNLMPGVNYLADLHFNIGTIPVKINKLEYDYRADSLLEGLAASGNIYGLMYTDTGKTVIEGTQIHPDERVSLELHISIPQDNDYQGLTGSFTCYIGIIQWTDPCEPECDPDIELIVNGGFEYPIVEHSAQWDIFPSGTPDLGWNVEWIIDDHPDLPDSANLELHRGVSGWLPYEGEQYTELDSDFDGPDGSINNEPASVRIYQDIPTVPGRSYWLSFAFSPRPNTDGTQNILNVSWDGTTVVILTADGSGKTNTDWTVYTYVVTATSETTRVAFADDGIPNSMGTFLDAVSVKSICE